MGYFDSLRYSSDDRKKAPEHIRGIVCDVKNCAYHDGDSYCTANRIAIGPSYATSSTETICASFKPKSL